MHTHLLSDLYTNGYCLLPSLISRDTCDKLLEYLNKNISEDLPYNYLKGHYLIPLPKQVKNLPREIILHPTINKIVSETLGKSYYLYSYTCNAIQVNKNQPYHMDYCHLHSQRTIKLFGSPGPPHHLIVNVYLQDTDERNGSLDIVPGSHLWTDFEIDSDGKIDNKYISNNVRCNLPKGSVIIRDKRTWHRGTRNSSPTTRFMAGFGFSSRWFVSNELVFEHECKEILDIAPFSTWNIKYSNTA